MQLCYYFQSCDPLYGLLEVHVSNSTCSMFYLLDWLVMCHSDCVTVLWLLLVSTLDPRSQSSKKHPQEHRTNQREDVRPTPKGAGLNASGMGVFSRAPSLWQGQRGKYRKMMITHELCVAFVQTLLGWQRWSRCFCSNTAWTASWHPKPKNVDPAQQSTPLCYVFFSLHTQYVPKW